MQSLNATINKNCSCGRRVEGDYELCGVCKSKKLTPSCRHYTELEKTCTVPYCLLYDRPIMSFGYYKCRECEEKEGIK